MPRNILLVTTSHQRFDSLGCNGGRVARTPVADSLARRGRNYQRAYSQNAQSAPARCTMLTGQYPRTHGVTADGIALPVDAPSIAAHLASSAGYRTALIGKANFEPASDVSGRWEESARWLRGDSGPWRGFDYSVQASHMPSVGGVAYQHYGQWLHEHHRDYLDSFAGQSVEAGGDTASPATRHNHIPSELYHTEWIADRATEWIDTVPDDTGFFCWMSFPDPHYPWDPPESEMGRVNWRDLDLPIGHPGSTAAIRKVLAEKPAHWLGYFDGTFANREGGPGHVVPGALRPEQLLEITARAHVMVELIDEALGGVLDHLERMGRLADTDVIFTSDGGDLQGDFGLLFTGPWQVDSVMRIPMIWAPALGTAAEVLTSPVGQIDLAPTLCAIAGIDPAAWMQGTVLPPADSGSDERRGLSEWDSRLPGWGMHLRSVYRDGWSCTAYLESTDGQPNGLESVAGAAVLTKCGVHYDGTEGELYDLREDPLQWHNLWDDPGYQSVRDDLVDDMMRSLPVRRRLLPVEAPA